MPTSLKVATNSQPPSEKHRSIFSKRSGGCRSITLTHSCFDIVYEQGANRILIHSSNFLGCLEVFGTPKSLLLRVSMSITTHWILPSIGENQPRHVWIFKQMDVDHSFWACWSISPQFHHAMATSLWRPTTLHAKFQSGWFDLEVFSQMYHQNLQRSNFGWCHMGVSIVMGVSPNGWEISWNIPSFEMDDDYGGTPMTKRKPPFLPSFFDNPTIFRCGCLGPDPSIF